MRYAIRLSFVLVICFLVAGSSYAQQIPTGVSIDLDTILNLGRSIGGFLYTLGGIVAVITVISSGMMYLFAGSSQQKIATAKGILKAGIIGTLILFGSGMIISTIRGFATNPFQFFGTGGAVCQGGIRAFQPCVSNFGCPNDQPGTCGGAGQPLCSYSLCY